MVKDQKLPLQLVPVENYFIGILLYAQYCIYGDNSVSLILLIKGDNNNLKYLEKKENCIWVCFLDDEDIINYILTIGEDDSIYRYQSKEYKQLNISQLKESLLNDNSNNDNKIYIDTSGGLLQVIKTQIIFRMKQVILLILII